MDRVQMRHGSGWGKWVLKWFISWSSVRWAEHEGKFGDLVVNPPDKFMAGEIVVKLLVKGLSPQQMSVGA